MINVFSFTPFFRLKKGVKYFDIVYAGKVRRNTGRIAKTLSFMVGGEPVLIVMAGDVKIDNAKYKAKFGKKAKMLTMDEVVALIGHAVGGVCPFAVNEGVSTYLDESLKRFPTVFPACGSSNSAIELNMEELERFSRSKEWIDVTKVI